MENNAGTQLSPSCQPEPNTGWLAKRVRLTADTETPPLFLNDELSKFYDNEAKR